MRHGTRVLASIAMGLVSFVAVPRVSAQGTCQVNNRANCLLGGTAGYGMNLTVTTVVRLQIPSATVALGTATAAEFTAGFGVAILTPVTIRANRSWTVTLASTAAFWTGVGPAARSTKPVSELQWGTGAGGPFADLTMAQTTIGVGPATAGTVVTLYFRPRYAWTLDTPGAYSLPLQLTITAP